MSDRVGNPEDLFSHNEAHMLFDTYIAGDFAKIFHREPLIFLITYLFVLAPGKINMKLSVNTHHEDHPINNGTIQTIPLVIEYPS